ncbi:MAG: cupin domain-containing protein [Pseudomonadales bacterium]
MKEIRPTRTGSLADVEAVHGAPAHYLKRAWFDGRTRLALAKAFGLTQFGVNHTTLAPGAYSALRHWHEREDEFVFVLDGRLTVIDDNGEHEIGAGEFCAFPAGVANAHHVANFGDRPVVVLEIGARRREDDVVHYPDDDLGPVRRE